MSDERKRDDYDPPWKQMLAGYRDRWAELETSTNPFAVVTQAHLKAQETAGSDEARYQAKLGVIRSLYRRGYQRQAILDLFRFIDWVLALPEGLEDRLWTEIEQWDEEQRMHYLASFERKAQEQGQVKFLNFLLRQRFGELPEWVEARLQASSREDLERWGISVLKAGSLEEVFGDNAPERKPH